MKEHLVGEDSPLITKRLIDGRDGQFGKVYTEGGLHNVSPFDFKNVPLMSKPLFSNRQIGGKTAFVCPNDYLYGMFRMYTAFADMEEMPFKYVVFKTMREAIVWVKQVG